MRLIIEKNTADVARWTARYIVNEINKHQKTSDRPFVLGLPTGSTPMGTYRELIQLCRLGEVSFRNVITFNMDEYVGIPEDHAQSYHTFMWDNLFSHIDINPENVNILNGNAPDLQAECDAYEAKIKAVGGIDLFMGGIGEDGHIAFNEPFSSLQSRTRVKTLTEDTRTVNSRFFGNDPSKVPTKALTVGVGTIMDARQVLILALGPRKANAVQQCVEGPLNHQYTVTALQIHPRGIMVCDDNAVINLKVGTYRYFLDIERDNL